MMCMKNYKIVVLTLQGTPLTFHVSRYSIIEGDFVAFTDQKTNIPKQFHASRCEITELSGGYQ